MAGSLLEVRLLDGPNLYFPRPAAKVTFDLTGLLRPGRGRRADLRRGRRAVPVPPRPARLGLPAALRGPGGRSSGPQHRPLGRRHPAGDTFPAGPATTELVVAYPWRNSGKAEALAQAVASCSTVSAVRTPVAELVAAAGELVAAAPRGAGPRLLRPTIPVVAITGTNGKTTTSRMLGHIALPGREDRSAGRAPTGSTSTVSWWRPATTPGRAVPAACCRYPGIELAVTETARGGILRRGVGVAYNDVSVVTNISADHLGLGGIDTLDQLAEVKAVVTKITKPTGWCVLNADDPRTFAMRLGTKAQVWVFTRDPDSPNGRAVIDAGGRVSTVLDGWIAVLRPGNDPLPVIEVADVPMTLAGLSRVNIENALAATSAALASGFSVAEVADGLGSFTPAENPGRMNVWTLPVLDGTASVVIDLRPQRGRARGPAGDPERDPPLGLSDPARAWVRPATGATTCSSGWVRWPASGRIWSPIVQKPEYLRGRSAERVAELIR